MKSCPAFAPATSWCSHESRTVGPADAGHHRFAADAPVPAGVAGRRPDRRGRDSARGRAADQRPHGRHPRQRRRLARARCGRTGHQAARSHRQGHRRRRARLQPDRRRPRHGHRALSGRDQVRGRDPARPREDPRQSRPHSGRHSRAADRRARHQRRRRHRADAFAEAGGRRALDRQGSLRTRRQAALRIDEGRQHRPDLHFRRRRPADPGRARSGKTVAVRRDAAAARRQGEGRQPFVHGRPGPRRRQGPQRVGGPDAGRHSRHRPAADLDPGRTSGLRQGRRQRRHRAQRDRAPRLERRARRQGQVGAGSRGQPGAGQARRRQRGGRFRGDCAPARRAEIAPDSR